MDPVTALSTASCIVQFLDFGVRVVSKGNKIYRSIDGTLAETLDLELITNDLLLIQTKLQRSTQALGLSDTGEEDAKALRSLSRACVGAAERLLRKLNMAKAQGRFRRWKSLRQALKSVGSKAEVEEMARILLGFRSELQLRIMISLRYSWSADVSYTTDLLDRDQIDLHALDHTDRVASLDRTALEVLQALKENRDLYETSSEAQSSFLSHKLDDLNTLMHQTGHEIKKTVDIVSDDLQRLGKASQTGRKEKPVPFVTRKTYAIKAIIASLMFPGMDDRYEAVVEAHAQTFSWIFSVDESSSQRWDSFTSWLECGDDLYWIKGKAASGKSTLMRYIYCQQATCNHLKAWADHKQLIIPKFYFWSLGLPIQKSQIGLFRSLLYQIFDADPDLVDKVLPQLVHDTASFILEKLAFRNTLREWTLKELTHVFWTLVNRDDLSVRYCFFVDGLDEFDGDFLELGAFLRAISSRPNAKVCISSRPLQDFEQQFGGVPKLRLQDLTIDDISLYVRDKLGDHPQFKVLSAKGLGESRSLIEEIVSMSSGVFLWVSLVVKSLLKGLTNRDTLADLRKRLRELPDELDGLYSQMLTSIRPPFYLEQASRLLQLLYHQDQPMTAACLSFADDDDPHLVFEKGFDSVGSSEFLRRTEAMTLKLRSRCAGLLEVSRNSDHESSVECYVRYLHLTVKEYLEKPEVWANLLALTQSSGFDAILSLLRSSILLLKSKIPSASTTWGRNLRTEIEASMRLAVRAEHSSGSAQPELLRVLDQILSELWLAKRGSSSTALHWSTNLQAYVRCPNSLLEFATISGLTLYVKNELKMGSKYPRRTSSARSLLDYATVNKPPPTRNATAQPTMVAMLLEAGYHPNEISGKSTPWNTLLTYMAHECGISRRLNGESDAIREYTMFDSSWLDVCKLFVLSGADLYAGYWDKDCKEYIFAWRILAMAFEHLPGPPFLELQRMFEERGVDTSDGRGLQRRPHRSAISGAESIEPRRCGPLTGPREPRVSSTSRVRASYRSDGSLRQVEYQTEYPRSCSYEGLEVLRHNSRQCRGNPSPPSREQYTMYRDDDGCSQKRQRPTHWCEHRQDSHPTRYIRHSRPSSYWEGDKHHNHLDDYNAERHPAPSRGKQSQYGHPDVQSALRHWPSRQEDQRRRWRPY